MKSSSWPGVARPSTGRAARPADFSWIPGPRQGKTNRVKNLDRPGTQPSRRRAGSRGGLPSLGEIEELARLDIGDGPERHPVPAPMHDIVAMTLRQLSGAA